MKSCQHCKKDYKPHRSANRFCSLECWYNFRCPTRQFKKAEERYCEMCANTLCKKKNRSLKDFQEQRFCSNECRVSWKKTETYSNFLSEITTKWYRQNGVTGPVDQSDRYTSKYKYWRRVVLERDKYSCQECCDNQSPLHVDHVKPFALFQHLRFEPSNGRTLCISCHKKTETYGKSRVALAKLITQ